jgi:hypothetical protein
MTLLQPFLVFVSHGQSAKKFKKNLQKFNPGFKGIFMKIWLWHVNGISKYKRILNFKSFE